MTKFKSESFIVLMTIAWTYLLHAYYRQRNIEYWYFEQKAKRRKFDRTKRGAFKYWQLERCLNYAKSPIDKDTTNNLRFLTGLRNEIEHQMTRSPDNYLSARNQACARAELQRLLEEALWQEARHRRPPNVQCSVLQLA